MSSVTVASLAKIIGSEGEALLSQMKEAGLNHSDINDEVTDQDKKTLLEFLKEQQNKSSKTISLNKTASKPEPEAQGTVSITRKTISKESSGIASVNTQRTSATINFDENGKPTPFIDCQDDTRIRKELSFIPRTLKDGIKAHMNEARLDHGLELLR